MEYGGLFVLRLDQQVSQNVRGTFFLEKVEAGKFHLEI